MHVSTSLSKQLLIVSAMCCMPYFLPAVVASNFMLVCTVFHEYMHFIIAVWLGAKPSLPEISLRAIGNGQYLLGSVTANVTSLTAAAVALSPVLCTAFIPFFLNPVGNTFQKMFSLFMAASLVMASSPSRIDWDVAFKHGVPSIVFAMTFLAPVFIACVLSVYELLEE